MGAYSWRPTKRVDGFDGLTMGCQRVVNRFADATFSQRRCHGISGKEHSTKYANTLQHVLCSSAHRNGLSTSLRLCSKAPVAWLRLWTHAARTTHCAQSALCSAAPSVLRNPSMQTHCSTWSVAPPIETASQLHFGCALKHQSPGCGSGRTQHALQHRTSRSMLTACRRPSAKPTIASPS